MLDSKKKHNYIGVCVVGCCFSFW